MFRVRSAALATDAGSKESGDLWTSTGRMVLAILCLITGGALPAYARAFPVFGPNTYVRKRGEPVPVTDTFTVLNPNTKYILRVTDSRPAIHDDDEDRDRDRSGDKDRADHDNEGERRGHRDKQYDGGVSAAVITLNGVRVVDTDDFKNVVSVLNVPIILLASNQISVEVLGRTSGKITVQIFGVDNNPPTIKATVSPAPNAAGWNNTNVTVTFTCSDAISGIATCPQPQKVTTEGANQIISGTATDNAGNKASTSITLTMDKTPPSVRATTSPGPNPKSWNNSNVTVSFVCSDSLSGVATCPSPVIVSTEGSNQVISGTATDVAGNSSSASATVNVDKTPPSLSITSPTNGATFSTSAITVLGTVSDSLSGVSTVTCNGTSATLLVGAFSCPVTLAIGGNALTVVAFDAAGNSTTQSETITLSPPPLIALVNPSGGQQGQLGLSVAITGQFTHFVQGTTQASFAAGITVASLTVNSATSLTAVLNIDPAASVGMSSVTVTTGSEVVALANGFTVNPGTPILTHVSPNSGQQGQQNLSVVITGQFTHFVQGTSTASFGSGITIISLTVNSPTNATAVLNVSPTATVGSANVSLATGSEVVMLANGFTVTPGTPAITQVSPNAGQQGQQSLSVAITGQFTHLLQATTVLSFGAGITVASLTVNSASSATAVLNIDPAAATGGRNATVTTGAEVVTLANGFTVTAGTPVLMSVSPNSGQQGQQNLSATISGQFTHFVQGTTTVNFGAGITVVSLMVNSSSIATAVLNIAPTAVIGPSPVTMTTGTEVVTLANGFTVTAGTPVLTLITPNTGQQGQQSLSVAITGQFTHLLQGTTTASFGAGITVASLTVSSATSATAVLNIDPAAASRTEPCNHDDGRGGSDSRERVHSNSGNACADGDNSEHRP